MQDQLGPRWVPAVVTTCARCDERAEGSVLVGTRDGSFRLELCARHLGEMLDGARPAPSD